MKDAEREFKGVWITAEVWLSKVLSLQEKVFLVEIDSLDNENGCYASNSYFASFFQVSGSRASQVITSLKEKGFIKIAYIREGKEIKRRVINILKGGSKLPKGGIKKTKGGYLGNAEDNNPTTNNTSSNTDNKEKGGIPPKTPYPHLKHLLDLVNSGDLLFSDLSEELQREINEGVVADSLPDPKPKEEEKKKVAPKKKADPPPAEELELPHGSGFSEAWEEWKAYKRERRDKFTERSQKAQLKKLSEVPEKTAIAMIEKSIESGWKGLFVPEASKFTPKGQPPTQEEKIQKATNVVNGVMTMLYQDEDEN